MTFLQVHAEDDVLVALNRHSAGESVKQNGRSFTLLDDVPAKHKVAVRDLTAGESLKMYGMVVARSNRMIRAGQLLTTENVTHATDVSWERKPAPQWKPPDVSRWREMSFQGFIRDNGSVGTRNYWVVAPLVFCENRNLEVMRDAMIGELGYTRGRDYRQQTRKLIEWYSEGKPATEAIETTLESAVDDNPSARVFPNLDGVKFLTHDGGCGGAYEDAVNLCGLLAGYINHPNVAGATVFSLGCQKAHLADLEEQLHRRDPGFNKPLLVFDQQRMASEQTLISEAIRHTFAGLIAANRQRRQPAPLGKLVVGLECGGSDGFSGISANPAIGHCGDLLVALDGTVVLSEFPELAGCENELAGRCMEPALAKRFLQLMKSYEARLVAVGNDFASNPSPGNIREGLITIAIKSAGAARKGGSSPIVDVLDYPEPITCKGLNLLCTPGNDVESTTAMAGSGATAMLFSTGLGTPTGNPVAPVLKVASNSELFCRMPDIIDCDAGGIVTADQTIEEVGQRLLEQLITTASGVQQTKAEQLGQDDFIPWKRSLTS